MYSSPSAADYAPSRITRLISQGGRPPSGPTLRAAGYDMLVLCAIEVQPPSEKFPGLEVIRVGIDDGNLSEPELERAKAGACHVAAAVRRGQRVLVTCQMGLNRSGLVTAIALHLLTGRSGPEIVSLVQLRRKNALCNPSFVATLNQLRPFAVHRGA